jgi:hypothetical protein
VIIQQLTLPPSTALGSLRLNNTLELTAFTHCATYVQVFFLRSLFVGTLILLFASPVHSETRTVLRFLHPQTFQLIEVPIEPKEWNRIGSGFRAEIEKMVGPDRAKTIIESAVVVGAGGVIGAFVPAPWLAGLLIVVAGYKANVYREYALQNQYEDIGRDLAHELLYVSASFAGARFLSPAIRGIRPGGDGIDEFILSLNRPLPPLPPAAVPTWSSGGGTATLTAPPVARTLPRFVPPKGAVRNSVAPIIKQAPMRLGFAWTSLNADDQTQYESLQERRLQDAQKIKTNTKTPRSTIHNSNESKPPFTPAKRSGSRSSHPRNSNQIPIPLLPAAESYKGMAFAKEWLAEIAHKRLLYPEEMFQFVSDPDERSALQKKVEQYDQNPRRERDTLIEVPGLFELAMRFRFELALDRLVEIHEMLAVFDYERFGIFATLDENRKIRKPTPDEIAKIDRTVRTVLALATAPTSVRKAFVEEDGQHPALLFHTRTDISPVNDLAHTLWRQGIRLYYSSMAIPIESELANARFVDGKAEIVVGPEVVFEMHDLNESPVIGHEWLHIEDQRMTERGEDRVFNGALSDFEMDEIVSHVHELVKIKNEWIQLQGGGAGGPLLIPESLASDRVIRSLVDELRLKSFERKERYLRKRLEDVSSFGFRYASKVAFATSAALAQIQDDSDEIQMMMAKDPSMSQWVRWVAMSFRNHASAFEIRFPILDPKYAPAAATLRREWEVLQTTTDPTPLQRRYLLHRNRVFSHIFTFFEERIGLIAKLSNRLAERFKEIYALQRKGRWDEVAKKIDRLAIEMKQNNIPPPTQSKSRGK